MWREMPPQVHTRCTLDRPTCTRTTGEFGEFQQTARNLETQRQTKLLTVTAYQKLGLRSRFQGFGLFAKTPLCAPRYLDPKRTRKRNVWLVVRVKSYICVCVSRLRAVCTNSPLFVLFTNQQSVAEVWRWTHLHKRANAQPRATTKTNSAKRIMALGFTLQKLMQNMEIVTHQNWRGVSPEHSGWLNSVSSLAGLLCEPMGRQITFSRPGCSGC